MAGSDPAHAIKTANIYVPNQIEIAKKDVEVTINQPNRKDPLWKGERWDNMYNSQHDYVIEYPKDGLTITWHNAAIDKATGRSLDITWVLNNIVTIPKDSPSNMANEGIRRQAEHGWAPPAADSTEVNSRPEISVYSNPIDEIGWYNVAGFTAKETLTYSDNGQEYNGTYYRTAGSLNAQYVMEHWEFASPVSGVLGSYIANDSLILPDEQDVSGYASAVTKKAFMIGPEREYGPGMGGAYGDTTRNALTKEGITFLVNNNSIIAYGVSGATGTGKNATAGDTDTYLLPSYSEHLMGNADIVATAIPMPRSNAHYHYDTS